MSRCFFHIASLLLISTGLAGEATADGKPPSPDALPLMFDPRERLAKPDLSRVGRVRFLTSVDYPPFNFIDQTGKLSGFQVDLAREICRELAIIDRCQIEALKYEDLQQALEEKEGDVIAAGIRVTPELRENFDFSRPYMQLPARFVALKGVANEASPLDLKNLPVGVVSTSLHEAMLARFFPEIQRETFSDPAQMLAALKSGTIKAAFGNAVQFSFWLESETANGCCQFLGRPYYSREYLGEGLSMMVRKTDPELKAAIDQALVVLAKNGRLNELFMRYFPGGI